MPKTNRPVIAHHSDWARGEKIEIQIRRRHALVAERGMQLTGDIKGGKPTDGTADKFEWLKDLVNLHQQMGNTDEFIDTVRKQICSNLKHVFTPKGGARISGGPPH